MECPSSEQWAAYASGSGTRSVRAQLAEHGASCPRCRGVLSGIAVAATVAEPISSLTVPDSVPSAPVAGLLAPGTRLGRYVVERTLGAGGMGVVYVARDPELDRKVAIKLLRAGAPSERLRREAKALAKLDHPNVVRVYDVGEHAGQSFVAMALVDGQNLRQWREQPHTLREAVRVIIAAGRGLAAAHAAGLIHRDLKPDNVFVSARGEVLVGDFGLARNADALDEPGGGTAGATADLTATGAILGTPAYMAPEHFAGEPTAASDQFALCVTAWETLHGERPFAGTTFEEVLAAACRGEIAEPADRSVPNRVRRALERGLAPDPVARWPSVDALLAELAGDRTRRRRTIALAAGGVAVVLAGAWGVTMLAREAPARCRSSEDRLATVWTAARATELRDTATRIAPYALTSMNRAVEWLDAYARRWEQSWASTCSAEISDAGFDLRVACLEGRLHALATASRTLGEIDRTSARTVLDVAVAVPAVEHCDDLATLRKVAPPPAAIAGQITTLERTIASGDALAAAGRFREAEPILRRTQQDAAALGFAGTQARAELALGYLMMRQSNFTEAKPHLETALNHAIAASDDEAAARSYVRLAVTAVTLADVKRGRELVATADAAVRRIGDPPQLRARLIVVDASIPVAEGDLEVALPRVTAAIEKLEAGRFNTELAALYRIHSALLIAANRHDDARAVLDHEVDVSRELFGPGHPDHGDALVARGSFKFSREQYAEARADFELGHRTLNAALGPDDVLTVSAGAELATLDLLFGRYDEAIAKLQLHTDTVAPKVGPRGEAISRRALGTALLTAGRFDAAERELTRALELDRGVPGPYILADELGLATLRCKQQRFDDAQMLIDRVRPELVKLFGPDHGVLADIWLLQARIHVARGQTAEALAMLAKVTTGPAVAEAKIIAARALDRRGDTAGAAAARRVAVELLDKIGPGSRPDLRAEL